MGSFDGRRDERSHEPPRLYARPPRPPKAAWSAWAAQWLWYASATRPRGGASSGPLPDAAAFAGSSVRASDQERERVSQALSQHYGEGRLDGEELGDRLQRAMSARTRGELAPLLADLPSLEAHASPETRERASQSALTSEVAGALLLVVSVVGVALSAINSHLRVLGIALLIAALVLWRRYRSARALRLWHDHLHVHQVTHGHGPRGPVVYEPGLPGPFGPNPR